MGICQRCEHGNMGLNGECAGLNIGNEIGLACSVSLGFSLRWHNQATALTGQPMVVNGPLTVVGWKTHRVLCITAKRSCGSLRRTSIVAEPQIEEQERA